MFTNKMKTGQYNNTLLLFCIYMFVNKIYRVQNCNSFRTVWRIRFSSLPRSYMLLSTDTHHSWGRKCTLFVCATQNVSLCSSLSEFVMISRVGVIASVFQLAWRTIQTETRTSRTLQAFNDKLPLQTLYTPSNQFRVWRSCALLFCGHSLPWLRKRYQRGRLNYRSFGKIRGKAATLHTNHLTNRDGTNQMQSLHFHRGNWLADSINVSLETLITGYCQDIMMAFVVRSLVSMCVRVSVVTVNCSNYHPYDSIW